ncbi:hypothetical protein C6Y08_11730 [Lactiplantibacillus pentosus]|uniref:Uncharacterized protein n=1 Tax=Lactiplantibacillus pentosus TaxID=1589 RepID=A0ABD7IQU4_LACPE|nr:hypothetical protein C6Y08_11730 [Lactiplantibacillus pentosus]RMW46385.1 hypothetical protein D6U18_10540 [Lactiplantibacillus pentosus]
MTFALLLTVWKLNYRLNSLDLANDCWCDIKINSWLFSTVTTKKTSQRMLFFETFFGLAKQAHDDENPVLWILVGWQDTIDGRLFYDQRLARSGQV